MQATRTETNMYLISLLSSYVCMYLNTGRILICMYVLNTGRILICMYVFEYWENTQICSDFFCIAPCVFCN